MTPRTDFTPLLPAGGSRPVGRYSPGLAVALDDYRDLVMVSGQVASDQQGMLIGGDDPAQQADAVFDHLQSVLVAAGGGLSDLVSVVVYLVDHDDFPAVSEVRNRRLADPPPASTLVVVARLAEDGRRVEISGTAVVVRRTP